MIAASSKPIHYSLFDLSMPFPKHLLFGCLVMLVCFGPMSSTPQEPSPVRTNKTPRSLADYQPRTLAAIAQQGWVSKLESDPFDLDNTLSDTLILQANVLPSKVQVIFDGEQRPLESLKKDILDHWTRRYAGNPLGYTEVYQTEIRVFEGDRPYWLAFRTQDIETIRANITPNSVVELYVIGLGGAKSAEADTWEWLYLVVPTPTN